MVWLIISSLIIIYALYIRYFPIVNVPCHHMKDLNLENIKVIDLRDFNESYKEPVKGAMNIPIAYLKKNLNEIPDIDIHVVASSLVEKNIGIRLLKQQGFHVTGFTMLPKNNIHVNGKTLNYCK